MAKQRHSSSNSDIWDNVSPDSEGRISLDKNGGKFNCSRTLFGVAFCLVTLVFISNMSQLDFISKMFVTDPSIIFTGDEVIRKPIASCEYSDGPIFFNLKTSLGVSYDGGHW